MENSNGVVKVVGAVVVGALVGAALGILFAPEKGSRTRRHLIDGAKDLVDDLTDKLKDEAAVLRKKADKLEELAKEKMEDFKNNIKSKTAEATAPQN
ncbi:MAG: YtxH domain-containing protein [Paludibacter sp.]|nr:YtxH domain-containing protein [Paludibacter sp.]